MVNIDYIMNLLNWNSSEEDQEKGICLAQDVKCFNVFLQPCTPQYNKNVWDNCAKILSAKTNEDLYPYLVDLMLWLRDMNWPGAFRILDRLKKMSSDSLFQKSYNNCLKSAKAIGDETWESNLLMIQE